VAGAAVGGIVSSPRHVGTGLVLGAVIGGLLGSAAEESRAQAEEQRRADRRDAWQAHQMPVNDFRRAMSACMTGRGYSVR
jgi:outer membrane lipoprotein SlyB